MEWNLLGWDVTRDKWCLIEGTDLILIKAKGHKVAGFKVSLSLSLLPLDPVTDPPLPPCMIKRMMGGEMNLIFQRD